MQIAMWIWQLKEILSDSSNIFLWHDLKDISKKDYFKKKIKNNNNNNNNNDNNKTKQNKTVDSNFTFTSYDYMHRDCSVRLNLVDETLFENCFIFTLKIISA